MFLATIKLSTILLPALMVAYFFGLGYFMLRDDFQKLLKVQSFKDLTSENLVILMAKLKMNRLLFFIEIFASLFAGGFLSSSLIELLGINLRLLLFFLFMLPFMTLMVYRARIRVRKQIAIHESIERILK